MRFFIGLLLAVVLLPRISGAQQTYTCPILCNADFENNIVTTVFQGLVFANQGNIDCWNTSAPDGILEVWRTGYNGVPSFSGLQYIELNANYASSIYQDFPVPNGSTAQISFAHRGRAGVDVMSVEVGPVGGPYTSLGNFSAGNTAWVYNTVSYTFPAGASGNWRILFTSVSSAVNNQTIGNFIDAISIELTGIVLIPTLTQPTCPGASNGSISLNLLGGAPPYTFTWNQAGLNSGSVSSLPAGSYTCTITDQLGCDFFFDTALTAPPAIQAQTSSTLTQCQAATGTASVLPSGGTPGYTYLWNTGASSAQASNLASGNYTVTVTDQNGCTAAFNQAVSAATAPVISNTQTIPVSCFGGSDGSAQIQVNASSAYGVSWSSGGAGVTASGLSAGNYAVTVTDANNCIAIANLVITQPPALLLSSTSTSVSCAGGNNGRIDLAPSGGTPGYTYAWSNGTTQQDPVGLAAGNYAVTVTDAEGCTTQLSATVTAPFPVLLTTQPDAVDCFGGSTGSIDLSVQGGTPGYSYLWSTGVGTQDIVGVPAGSYSVTVTDQNGCTVSTSAQVNAPSTLVLNGTPTNISCFGASTGSINLSVAGGTAGYQYSWSTGAITEDVQSLPAGSYTVTVTDANACSLSLSIPVTQASQMVLQVQALNAVCSGSGTNSIDLTVSGGSGPYQYSWSTGASTQDIAQLTDGTYTVSVTDVLGCTASASAQLSSQTTAVQLVLFPVDLNCAGDASGSIDLSVLGGTPGYTYQWSNGSGSEDPSGLQAGTYSVLVTDNNGCTETASVVVTEPAPITSTAAVTDVACPGIPSGAIDVNMSGGTAPLTFLWSGGQVAEDIASLTGGVYTLSITDARQCEYIITASVAEPPPFVLQIAVSNAACSGSGLSALDLTASGGTGSFTYVWSTGAISQDVSGIGNGSYTVTLTDASGCTAQAVAGIAEPAPILVSGVTGNLTCFGDQSGSIDFSVSGGVGAYAYVWSGGQTSQDLTALSAGAYTVVVSDANGCTQTTSFLISEPPPLIAGITTGAVSCSGGADGSLDLSATGGSGTLDFTWNTGQVSEDIASLTAGTYWVIVSDDAGCTTTASATITQPAPLLITTQLSAPGCSGFATGTVDASISGGTPVYQYTWSNGSTTQDLINVQANTYTLTVSDQQGCTANTIVTIGEPAPLQLALIANAATCNGYFDGSLAPLISGGTAGYNYLWSTGSSAAQLAAVGAGTYTLLVSDAFGCTVSATALVTEPPPLQAVTVVSNLLCAGDQTGSIDLQISGGTPGYITTWSSGTFSEDLQSIAAGTYSVAISDANGCTTVQSALVSEPAILACSTNPVDVSCFGGSDGSISATVSGGTAPYQYSWNSTISGPALNGISAGTYTVVVTDGNGCTSDQSTAVTQPTELLVAGTAQDLTCYANQSGRIDIGVNGGISPYLFNWSNGTAIQDLVGVAAGTYQVLVTDANACTATQTFVVNEPPDLVSTLIGNDVSCHGLADGTATLLVTGGTQAYAITWNTGQNQAVLTGLTAGTYTALVTDANGCTVSSTLEITQPDPLLVSLPAIGPVFIGQDLNIDAQVFGGIPGYSFAWSDGSASSALTLTADSSASYILTVTDSRGCSATATVRVEVPDDYAFYVPNTFTPNDDGRNEGFTVYGIGLQSCGYRVYDRWGKIVFATGNCDQSWDGRFQQSGEPCPEGVYVYDVEVMTRKGLKKRTQGQIRLIR
ncbi:MAG: gliding motility-associated C-terminal domain-containing protein [Bacteroidota bacterium]